MRRRGFLAGILAAGVAPAAVGSGVLMPVRSLYLPPSIGSAITQTSDLVLQVTRERRDDLMDPLPFIFVAVNGVVRLVRRDQASQQPAHIRALISRYDASRIHL